MSDYLKEQQFKGMTIVIAFMIIMIAVIFIAFIDYEPEDLSNEPIIEEVALDECKSHNNEVWRELTTRLKTEPGSNAGHVNLPSCNGIFLDVYRIAQFEGEEWLLVRVSEPFNKGDEQGWVKRSSVVPR